MNIITLKKILELAFDDDDILTLNPCAKIKINDVYGIAFLLNENISKTWQAGSIIIFWQDGDITTLVEDQEFICISSNLWNAHGLL